MVGGEGRLRDDRQRKLSVGREESFPIFGEAQISQRWAQIVH